MIRDLFCSLVLVTCLLWSFGANAATVPADIRGDNVPFLPYLDYMIDPGGRLDVEEVALLGSGADFRPLKPLDFTRESGVFWLRFILAPALEGQKKPTWLLDLGKSVPGDPVFYVPELNRSSGMIEWQENPSTHQVLLLPEIGLEPKTCYIRLAGPPGLWFAPLLRSPHNAATNWASLSRPAIVLVLFVIMLLCLLRSFSERGQWRIWIALYVAAALGHGLLGLPAIEKGHITLPDLGAALLPGIALMLLPHVGRHLMRARQFSRTIDVQLILLTLIGTFLALLPLVPGCSWVARFLELWPLGTALFVPTALWALFLGLPASRRFLLACVLPPLTTAIGILGLMSGFAADMLAASPLCGVALSALLLATAKAPLPVDEQKKTEKSSASQGLRLIDEPLPVPTPDVKESAQNSPKEQKKEQNLTDDSSDSFNLQHLLREINDSFAPVAEQNNIGLAWYMPPLLEHIYKGKDTNLRETLKLLLASSLRATKHGSVRLSVRNVPESTDPGHLLFTVTDTGRGVPPKERSGQALAQAWELTGSTGYLAVDSGPNGTSVAFTLRLKCADAHGTAPGTERQPRCILVCSQNPSARQAFAQMLTDLPFQVIETDHLSNAVQINQDQPAFLVIIHDTLATPAAATEVGQFQKQAKMAHLPFCKILAVTKNDKDWNRLAQAGFTHALLEPVDTEALRSTAQEIFKDMLKATTSERMPKETSGQPSEEPAHLSDLTLLPVLMDLMKSLSAKPQKGAKDKKEKPVVQPAQQTSSPSNVETHYASGPNDFEEWVGEPQPITTDLKKNTTPPPSPANKPETGKADLAILKLVERLDKALADANKAFEKAQCPDVAEAAGRIARECDAFGFRVLARLSRCVEQAGQARDMNALRDLLPELAVAIERNKIALTRK